MALKLWIDELAFDLNVIALRISLGSEFSDHLPIHAHLTVDHQLFSVTPGRDTGSGDEFLQSLFHMRLARQKTCAAKRVSLLPSAFRLLLTHFRPPDPESLRCWVVP